MRSRPATRRPRPSARGSSAWASACRRCRTSAAAPLKPFCIERHDQQEAHRGVRPREPRGLLQGLARRRAGGDVRDDPARRRAAAVRGRAQGGRRQPESRRRMARHQPQHLAPKARRAQAHQVSARGGAATREPSMHALISVSDKTGVVELARELAALGIGLLSTGGTAKLLAGAGLAVTEDADHTGFPEMLDGRVKTLHPTIHGGLLARRDSAEHMAALETHGIATIDLLVVNLYPFEAAVARADCTLADAIENIDIGGPAMVRSAAKNWNHVTVLTDASQYAGVVGELKRSGAVSEAKRFALAVAAFDRIAQYDGAISDYLSSLSGPTTGVPERSEFPKQSNGRFVKLQDLRYGENPHQRAAFYRDLAPAPGSLVTARQLQGKELSYNNIADADAAWECVKGFDVPACVIVKHANPCGVALGANLLEAYRKAFA